MIEEYREGKWFRLLFTVNPELATNLINAGYSPEGESLAAVPDWLTWAGPGRIVGAPHPDGGTAFIYALTSVYPLGQPGTAPAGVVITDFDFRECVHYVCQCDCTCPDMDDDDWDQCDHCAGECGCLACEDGTLCQVHSSHPFYRVRPQL